ncbi:39989_t:CDS:2, partial [Gigaspora margarita]
MSKRTEDITRSTTANIYACVSNLAEITSKLSTSTQELTTKLLEFQIKQEKANTEFLTILDKIQNQIKKLENSKHSTELDYKLSQIANTIVLRERIHIKINQHLDWPKNKQKRKLSVAKNIGCEYVYNLEETSAAPYNRDVTEEYIKFFLRELKKNPKTCQHLLLDSNPSKLQENVIALHCSQRHCRKSVAQTKKASELTFSYPFKEVLKILQIDCTSPKISEDEAIRIIEQIDHAIRVDESGERISSQDKRYSSLANEIPKFKINKLPSWAVHRGAIHMSSSASSSSGS